MLSCSAQPETLCLQQPLVALPSSPVGDTLRAGVAPWGMGRGRGWQSLQPAGKTASLPQERQQPLSGQRAPHRLLLEQTHTLPEFLSVSSPQCVCGSSPPPWCEEPIWTRPGSGRKAEPVPEGEAPDPFLPHKMMVLGEDLPG